MNLGWHCRLTWRWWTWMITRPNSFSSTRRIAILTENSTLRYQPMRPYLRSSFTSWPKTPIAVRSVSLFTILSKRRSLPNCSALNGLLVPFERIKWWITSVNYRYVWTWPSETTLVSRLGIEKLFLKSWSVLLHAYTNQTIQSTFSLRYVGERYRTTTPRRISDAESIARSSSSLTIFHSEPIARRNKDDCPRRKVASTYAHVAKRQP